MEKLLGYLWPLETFANHHPGVLLDPNDIVSMDFGSCNVTGVILPSGNNVIDVIVLRAKHYTMVALDDAHRRLQLAMTAPLPRRSKPMCSDYGQVLARMNALPLVRVPGETVAPPHSLPQSNNREDSEDEYPYAHLTCFGCQTPLRQTDGSFKMIVFQKSKDDGWNGEIIHSRLCPPCMIRSDRVAEDWRMRVYDEKEKKEKWCAVTDDVLYAYAMGAARPAHQT